MKSKLTQKININNLVEDWWDKNPFSYNENKMIKKPTKKFFNEVNRKLIKWEPWAQTDNHPLSGVVDYPSLKNKKVLDIAIGTGWSTAEFALNGAKVIGIDITNAAVKLAQLRFKLFNLPKANIKKVDAQNLPFKDNTYDYVLAWGCLMHMPNTQKAINEIYRVLKKGGRAAAMMYNRNSLYWWYYMYFSQGIVRGKLLSMNTQQLINRFTDGEEIGGNPHTKLYTTDEVKVLFKKFKSVTVSLHDTFTSIDTFPHPKLPLGRYLPNRIKLWLTHVFGWNLWVEVTK